MRIKEYRQANREVISEYQRRWGQVNQGRLDETRRTYREANREQIREYGREHQATTRYGLTRAERDYIEETQLRRCAACLDPLGSDAQVDHDHACCGRETSCGDCVRGIVCGRCNKIVGRYENGTLRRTDLIELAAFYVDMTPLRMAAFRSDRTDLRRDAEDVGGA